jgi:hypothetical protein
VPEYDVDERHLDCIGRRSQKCLASSGCCPRCFESEWRGWEIHENQPAVRYSVFVKNAVAVVGGDSRTAGISVFRDLLQHLSCFGQC